MCKSTILFISPHVRSHTDTRTRQKEMIELSANRVNHFFKVHLDPGLVHLTFEELVLGKQFDELLTVDLPEWMDSGSDVTISLI